MRSISLILVCCLLAVFDCNREPNGDTLEVEKIDPLPTSPRPVLAVDEPVAEKPSLIPLEDDEPVGAFSIPKGERKLEAKPIGAFASRIGPEKSRLLREFGGIEPSELAVARGLAWLAKQQKADGRWVFDGTSKTDSIAATGMCLLPFLAANQTHLGGKYQQTVDRGLKYLVSRLTKSGKFRNDSDKVLATTMYSQALATMALCEAYGLTRDREFLQKPAQAAVDFIVYKQGSDGSWGYSPGTCGDTSIVGWQLQALKTAMRCREILVPDKTIDRANKFLDKVASGRNHAVYGYVFPNGAPATPLTAVGLLCRYYFSKWAPGHAGLAEGVEGLMKRAPTVSTKRPEMYFYYYATQVQYFADSLEWKDWNEGPLKDGKRQGGMRDWLIELQNKKDVAGQVGIVGSWDADGGTIGTHCGRIGTTALSILTLEVYYRFPQLYKRPMR